MKVEASNSKPSRERAASRNSTGQKKRSLRQSGSKSKSKSRVAHAASPKLNAGGEPERGPVVSHHGAAERQRDETKMGTPNDGLHINLLTLGWKQGGLPESRNGGISNLAGSSQPGGLSHAQSSALESYGQGTAGSNTTRPNTHPENSGTSTPLGCPQVKDQKVQIEQLTKITN